MSENNENTINSAIREAAEYVNSYRFKTKDKTKLINLLQNASSELINEFQERASAIQQLFLLRSKDYSAMLSGILGLYYVSKVKKNLKDASNFRDVYKAAKGNKLSEAGEKINSAVALNGIQFNEEYIPIDAQTRADVEKLVQSAGKIYSDLFTSICNSLGKKYTYNFKFLKTNYAETLTDEVSFLKLSNKKIKIGDNIYNFIEGFTPEGAYTLKTQDISISGNLQLKYNTNSTNVNSIVLSLEKDSTGTTYLEDGSINFPYVIETEKDFVKMLLTDKDSIDDIDVSEELSKYYYIKNEININLDKYSKKFLRLGNYIGANVYGSNTKINIYSTEETTEKDFLALFYQIKLVKPSVYINRIDLFFTYFGSIGDLVSFNSGQVNYSYTEFNDEGLKSIILHETTENTVYTSFSTASKVYITDDSDFENNDYIKGVGIEIKTEGRLAKKESISYALRVADGDAEKIFYFDANITAATASSLANYNWSAEYSFLLALARLSVLKSFSFDTALPYSITEITDEDAIINSTSFSLRDYFLSIYPMLNAYSDNYMKEVSSDATISMKGVASIASNFVDIESSRSSEDTIYPSDASELTNLINSFSALSITETTDDEEKTSIFDKISDAISNMKWVNIDWKGTGKQNDDDDNSNEEETPTETNSPDYTEVMNNVSDFSNNISNAEKYSLELLSGAMDSIETLNNYIYNKGNLFSTSTINSISKYNSTLEKSFSIFYKYTIKYNSELSLSLLDYTKWENKFVLYADGNNFMYGLLYISRELAPTMCADYINNDIISEIFSYPIIQLENFGFWKDNILSPTFITLFSKEEDLLSEYGVHVDKNANSESLPPSISSIDSSFDNFNNINLGNILNETVSDEELEKLSKYMNLIFMKYIYKNKDPLSEISVLSSAVSKNYTNFRVILFRKLFFEFLRKLCTLLKDVAASDNIYLSSSDVDAIEGFEDMLSPKVYKANYSEANDKLEGNYLDEVTEIYKLYKQVYNILYGNNDLSDYIESTDLRKLLHLDKEEEEEE